MPEALWTAKNPQHQESGSIDISNTAWPFQNLMAFDSCDCVGFVVLSSQSPIKYRNVMTKSHNGNNNLLTETKGATRSTINL